MSFRRVRSPEAPKMTSANGSSAYGMATELVAKRGQQPVREGVFSPRAEARVQRGRDDRRRHRLLDGVLDRPPALAGIVDVGLELREGGIRSQRVGGQLEQPRAHDAALVPQRGDSGQIEAVL